MSRGRRGALALVVVALLAPAARAQDDFSFEVLETEVRPEGKKTKGPTKAEQAQQALDAAKRLLDEEKDVEALTALERIRNEKSTTPANREEATYLSARALYRLRLPHAALQRYAEILQAEGKSRRRDSALAWIFFLSRRMEDQAAALELIARAVAPDSFPASRRDALNYELARYYLEVGLRTADDTEAKPQDSGDGDGFNFSEEPAEEGGGGFDFSDGLGGGDDDGFDFSLEDLGLEEGKSKSTHGKGKKKKGNQPAEKREPPPVEAPTEDVALREAPALATGRVALQKALEAVGRVREEDPRYPRAVYVEGLTRYALGEFEPAVAAFRKVVRLTHPKTGVLKSPKLREMALFSLARIHYQFEQFRYAVFYYERIERDSETWLDALFESSWAHFRLGEYEKALGNLVTIQSPFFIDEYYPESPILKAITFYENCRYPEARAFLEEFEGRYGPVIRELDGVLEADRPDDSGFYDELRALEERGKGNAGGEAAAVAGRLAGKALRDKRVKRVRAALEEVDGERKRLETVAVGLEKSVASTILAVIDTRRTVLAAEAGMLLRGTLEDDRASLKDLRSKLLRIRFEIAKQEKEGLEASLRGEERSVPINDYRYVTATDDERVHWPFEGEYWRDELGTYEYTLTRGCRSSNEGG